jgi:UDP-N-acetylmuramoyl-L-alanyl-D-glutamate--2,6-diaminopimelate ligase
MNGIDIKEHFKEFDVSQNITRNIQGISIDTRTMKAGDLFFGMHGENFDSHRLIDEAIAKGASGIVLQDDRQIPNNLLKVKVSDSREAYALISSLFFNFPSSKLKLVGITGTSGKTTTAFLLYDLFTKLGFKSGFIGTLGIGMNGKFTRMELHPPTTPDAFSLNKMLSGMVSNNVQYVFLEATSHGIKQKRVYGLEFAYKILTTMGEDHLDYHKTYEDYLKTKVSFFEEGNFHAILNRDSREFEAFDSSCKNYKFTYGIVNPSDLTAKNIELKEDHSSFNIVLHDGRALRITLSMSVLFNVYNFLAVSSCAILEGVSLEALQHFALNATKIVGRLEIYHLNGRIVVIDFAHNPLEVEEMLKFLNGIKGEGKLITVVGAVGGSTKEKRVAMGQAASNLSDFVFITTDDPRGDDIERLASEVFSGVNGNGTLVVDRELAIHEACAYSKAGDMIAVLGRGDEEEMHSKEGTKIFKDIQIATEALE